MLQKKGLITVLIFVILIGVAVSTYFWQMRHQRPVEINMAHPHPQEGPDHSHMNNALQETALISTQNCEAFRAEVSDVPIREFELTAEQSKITLDNGQVENTLSFNGVSPGPEIRVKEGERIIIALLNSNVEDGVTIHSHGIVLPCSQDGVAGVTQDVVNPGEQYRYEFIAGSPGTYWYHSHQMSSIQVEKGLLGRFIIEPKEPLFHYDQEAAILFQQLNDTLLVNGLTKGLNIDVNPGEFIRLRLINGSNETYDMDVNGAPYRIISLDGNNLNEPGLLESHRFRIGGGQRYDLLIQMPEEGMVSVRSMEEESLKIMLGSGKNHTGVSTAMFDFTNYGSPNTDDVVSELIYDRFYELELGQSLFAKSINGKSFHEIPPMIVSEGDNVKVTISSSGGGDHPFHLHGHTFRVLSKNGKLIEGSPVYLDTILLREGESFEIYIKADNPGLWMLHCHDLSHSSSGMTMMLNYEGISTEFRVGTKSGNLPDL